MSTMHLPRFFYPIYLPVMVFVGSMLFGVVSVATGTETVIRAQNIPLFPLSLGSTPYTPSMYTLEEEREMITPTSIPLPTITPSPAVIYITSTIPSNVPIDPMLSVPSVSEAIGCRQDCTFTSCEAGLSCLAISSDEGYYSYQCMNPNCHPNLQSNSCGCPEPTTGPVKK